VSVGQERQRVGGAASGAGTAAGAGGLPLRLDPVTEGYLDGLARLARRDPAARNALWARVEPFCERVAQRLASRPWVRLAELDDVRHEGFLVFCGLVTDWPERRSFAGFLFAHYPGRLAAALRRFEGLPRRRSPGRRDAAAGRAASPTDRRPTSEADAAVEGELAACELLAGLDESTRCLAQLLAAGYGVGEVARALGIDARTVRRRLARLRRLVA